MTRREFTQELIDSGISDAEIVAILVRGDAMKGMKPTAGKDEKEKMKWASIALTKHRKDTIARKNKADLKNK